MAYQIQTHHGENWRKLADLKSPPTENLIAAIRKCPQTVRLVDLARDRTVASSPSADRVRPPRVGFGVSRPLSFPAAPEPDPFSPVISRVKRTTSPGRYPRFHEI